MDANKTAINCKMANFPPSVWGDYFCKYAYGDSMNDHDISHEKNSELKEEVRRMITFDADNPLEMLDLIDQVQRLGISYLFATEIESTFEHIHKFYFEVSNGDINGDLYMVALLFRLLRQEGYKISYDVFDKFTDENGSFIESLTNDVRGILSLYEASHMRIHEEETLEYALTFSLAHLKTSLENKVVLTPLLKAQVMHALNQPIRKGLQRVAARQYFPIYQQDPLHIDNLLTLAKLDFNLVQKQHQKELSEMSRWWKELDFKKKLPFGRDRLVECYFWVSGLFFEPQYALGRKLMCKILVMITAIDDAYDVYGTIDELEHFTKVVQRWERDAQDELSNCMQVLYEALLDLYDEIGSLLAGQGKSHYLCYAKEGMKTLVRAYIQEKTWLYQNRIPSMEEYMSAALVTSGHGLGAIIAFIGMGDIITEDVLKWASTIPKIIKASAIILRLTDDIASRKIERKRDHVPSAVECYMNEHKVTEEEAEEELSRLISCAWKDINEVSLHPIFHMTILMRVINLARAPNYMYSGWEDQFTVNASQLKDIITSLYVDAVQI